jgi:dihydrofolate reductase
MSKVVLGMSMSLDGIAGPESDGYPNWGEDPPFHAPVFGDSDVLLAGGVSIARQALAAGLVDEIVLHVPPVVLGRAVRLFGAQQADLQCVETIHGEGAVHLRYELEGTVL